MTAFLTFMIFLATILAVALAAAKIEVALLERERIATRDLQFAARKNTYHRNK